MESKLLFLILLFAQALSGQTFTEAAQSPSFDGIHNGSIAFVDVDNDNDKDLLITGQNNNYDLISKLYTNDGEGNFTEVIDTPFDGVGNSSIAFADIDGDNDQDVLITGWSGGNNLISKLYTNDGEGNFTEVVNTPFDGVEKSSIAFADIDGDNDQDVLITGFKNINNSTPISKLYTNNGDGNFTEILDTPFNGAYNSSVIFTDVDGDNDQDVLISGQIDNCLTKLYINDGEGNFIEAMGNAFDCKNINSAAFADVDGDNDQDLITGGVGPVGVGTISTLYINNGDGNFTEIIDTPFIGAGSGSIAFADVDDDNDQDVLITGYSGFGIGRTSKLYINDGDGNFTEFTDTPFVGVSASSIAFADVDGDNDQDVLIAGYSSGPNDRISKLFVNDGVISLTNDLKIKSSLNFIAFPNPSTTTILYLNYDSAEISEVTIKVYNPKGVLLKQKSEFVTIGQNTVSIDIAYLVRGNYFVELDNGKSQGVTKITVQ